MQIVEHVQLAITVLQMQFSQYHVQQENTILLQENHCSLIVLMLMQVMSNLGLVTQDQQLQFNVLTVVFVQQEQQHHIKLNVLLENTRHQQVL